MVDAKKNTSTGGNAHMRKINLITDNAHHRGHLDVGGEQVSVGANASRPSAFKYGLEAPSAFKYGLEAPRAFKYGLEGPISCPCGSVI